MNEETFEALNRMTALTRKYAGIMSQKKRKTQGDVFDLACLYRDLVAVETWIDEVAKDYEDKTYCHLCGAVEEKHWCTNKDCNEYIGA